MLPLGCIIEQTHTISARRHREDLKRVGISPPLPHRRKGAGVAVRRSITIGWYHTYPGTQASQHRPPRARREIRGTMFMAEYHLPAPIQSPRGGPPSEGVGEGFHRGVDSVCSSYILLVFFLLHILKLVYSVQGT